ncbi:MAG: pilus assembly protein [Coprococcus sp.]
MLEIMNVQTVMRSALHCAAKEIAEEAYVNPLVIRGKLEKHIVEHVGETWLDHSVISGGSDGIDCRKSKAWGSTGIMDLSLIYKVEVPILMFRIPAIVQEESMRVKGWNGYAGNGFGNQSDETVYITDTGIVYHKDADCTYLELSIKSVAISDVEQLRNESGGKYYPCESCMRKTFGKQMVYITDTGNRYHGSLSCSRLKRTVYAVPLSEVFGRGGCKRCVK